MRHPEQVREDGGGLQRARGVDQHVGPLGQQPDEVDGVRLREEIDVGVVEVVGVQAGFACNGAEARVRVLEVRACVAFEGGHGIEVEVVAVDAVLTLVKYFFRERKREGRGWGNGGKIGRAHV